jgi:hypothetical protein
MSLAFARGMSPATPYLMAAVLSGRRPGRRPLRRDWLRMADRLAVGMSPAAAALPEGLDAAMVDELLAQEDFRELVEATKACLEEPPEVQHRQLVILARQTLERALAWDDDPKAALFVLEEDARGRDPAVSLAEGVLKAQRRALAAPPARPSPPAPPRPFRPPLGYAPGYDPLRAMMHRGAAKLRDMIRTEDAIRHAATAAAEPPRTTAEAARHALALKSAAGAAELPQESTRLPRHDALAARLRSGTAAGAVSPAAVEPHGLLRAWAQGP